MSARARRGVRALLAPFALLGVAALAPLAAQVPAVVTQSRIDTSRGVDFHAAVLRDTVYVGEQVTYQVGVFLDDDTRLRLRRSPEFVPSEPQAMLGYEVAPSANAVARSALGKRYVAHVFQRALFPLTPGRLDIPPAQLIYTLPLSSSFFSREESHTLRTEKLAVVAVEPPAAGRPADYDGAVGALAARATLDGAAPRVGDPLTLTVHVTGTGNVKLFPRPRLDVPWASAVPSGERVRVDTASPMVAGEKQFDWILTPREAGPQALPALRYPYFDPAAARYAVAMTDAITVDVAPGTLAPPTAAATVSATPAPTIRRAYRGPLPDPAPLSTPFWAVAALAPAPALGLRALARWRRPRPRRPAAKLRRVARAAARRGHVRDLRGAFADAIAWRVGTGPVAIAAPGAASRALRRAGVTPATAAEAEALLADLAAGAFATSADVGASPAAAAAQRARRLYARVDREALPRVERADPRLGRALALLIASLAVGAGVARAADGTSAARAFAEAVHFYDAREYSAAARRFADAGAAEPRAADAWANAGTAAWAAADTTSAVVGWQRALRLEPTAVDVRERITAFAPNAGSAEAAVPRVPPAATALGALLLWCAAWLVALARARRGARWGRPVGFTACMAIAVGGAALWSRRALGAADLRVVSARAPVRVAPALGGDGVGVATVGEVARVIEERGAWTHVRLDADRDGWVETPSLVPLAPPPPARTVR